MCTNDVEYSRILQDINRIYIQDMYRIHTDTNTFMIHIGYV